MTNSQYAEFPALDKRIQAYLRATMERGTDHQRVGPFLAGFDCDSDNPYRNYAIPDEGSAPSQADIAALIAAFVERKRKPRLEYIRATAPAVEAALLSAGFEAEKRYPILICTPDRVRDAPADGIDIALTRDAMDIDGAAAACGEAFGDPAINPAPLLRLVEQGGVMAVARDPDGVIVGAGMAPAPHEGVAEVAGIGVRPAFQRRGIAGALTALVTRESFARGTTLAWLTPGSDGAERIYARAGYARASEQLHISKPM